jgi:pimeloyl-ACP methyl ester carboxylesterase
MYKFFNYKNIKIRVKTTGHGYTIVLLHGFLENLSIWHEIASELSKKNRIIAIDLLGHGETGNLGYIHTMEDQAKMVKAILKQLKIRKCILIGHSMGGYVCLAYSELFTDNVRGLCLLNSSPLADTKDKMSNRDRAIEAVKQNRKTFIRIAIKNLFAKHNQAIFKEDIEIISKAAITLSNQGIIAALEGMKIRKGRLQLFKTAIFKKLLIIGRQDPTLDYRLLLDLTKKTTVKVVEFPDGHMSYIENKNELLPALKSFVKSCN